MLQVTKVRQVEKTPETKKIVYKKHQLGNSGRYSYWVKFKINEEDIRFTSVPKRMIIKFDKELSNLGNENIAALNEWKVTKVSYSSYLSRMCEELNFFEALYDREGELITALFRIKYLIDVDNYSYTMRNFDAFTELCYKTIFTPSLKSKITNMVEENYIDDIEAENAKNLNNPEMMTIMQRKKKSLEFKNEHVKAMLEISFGIKILSFIITHFCTMRGINVQKNLDILYKFYLPMFTTFEHDFSTLNKIWSYVENKVNSAKNFNRLIFEQQEINRSHFS